MNPFFRRRLGGWAAMVATLALLAGCAAPMAVAPTSEPKAATPMVEAARPQAKTGDAFVVISGGGTPLSNNYSQFLQARDSTTGCGPATRARRCAMFSARATAPGVPAVFADARKQVKDGGLVVESWLPGVLEKNRAATKAEILGALKNEIYPAWRRAARSLSLWATTANSRAAKCARARSRSGR